MGPDSGGGGAKRAKPVDGQGQLRGRREVPRINQWMDRGINIPTSRQQVHQAQVSAVVQWGRSPEDQPEDVGNQLGERRQDRKNKPGTVTQESG